MGANGIEPTGEVHPAAAVFPMLPEDELAELAADIAANGLIHPVVLDSTGAIVDGRNRLAACRLAGVEPRFVSLNGEDPVAYVLSANITRRHLSKGQRAVAAVLANASGKLKNTAISDRIEVNTTTVSEASVVVRFAPELALEVVAGTRTLAEAYERARERKAEGESLPARQERMEQERSELWAKATDLAELVESGALTHRQAWAAWQERQQEERDRRTRMTKNLWHGLVEVWAVLAPDAESPADDWMAGVRGFQGADAYEHLLTADGLRDLARSIDRMASAVGRRGGRLE
jgi:ParB-like chromosome segregation protein Spo0J